MKALKVIGIILLIIVAILLIVGLAQPRTASVSAENHINPTPGLIFPAVASFTDREAWDPWVETDETAVVTTKAKSGYVGSTYSWEGEDLGRGRMEVIKVTENEYIEAHLWFGNVENPALVTWNFTAEGDSTLAVWGFQQETTGFFNKLGMAFGKMFLKKSFETGLVNLKEHLEEKPPSVQAAAGHGDIGINTQAAFHAIVAPGGGTMEEMKEQLPGLFRKAMEGLSAQGLQIAGPAFVHYKDYDEETGYSNYLAGFQVNGEGANGQGLMTMSYGEVQALQTVHTGPYDDFTSSYEALMVYMTEKQLDVTGEAFEFYIVSAHQEQDPAKWQTLISFPLK